MLDLDMIDEMDDGLFDQDLLEAEHMDSVDKDIEDNKDAEDDLKYGKAFDDQLMIDLVSKDDELTEEKEDKEEPKTKKDKKCKDGKCD